MPFHDSFFQPRTEAKMAACGKFVAENDRIYFDDEEGREIIVCFKLPPDKAQRQCEELNEIIRRKEE